MRRVAIALMALSGAMLLGLAFAVWHGRGDPDSAGAVPIGGPFALVDQTGKPVTQAEYRGRLMLVFFGFTHCPDVCPTALDRISHALDRLGEDAKKVQPIFITVDPERDDPATLAAYLDAFDPRIIGLTGTPEQIAAAARAYRVYYSRAEPAGQDGGGDDYMVNHSAIVYLMDRDGSFLTHFPHMATAEDLAATIRRHL